MKKLLLILGLLIFNLLSQMEAAAEKPLRLAIVSEPALRNAADLLTAELSGESRLALIDRDEIDKVFKEQEIQAGHLSEKNIQLGKLLNADGLILITQSKNQDQPVHSARLVAVDPGVVLWETPGSVEANLSAWIQYVSTSLKPFYSKLGISRKDAIPISLLRLQASLKVSGLMSIEESINLLLRQRLLHESRIFVLERWRMEALVFEKKLSENEKTFWNGGCLVDGNIEMLGGEEVLVKARLRSPGDEKIQNIEIRGKQKALPELIESLAQEISTRLAKSPLGKTWDPAQESSRFQKEAASAENCGYFSRAREAAEAACALYPPDSQLRMMRARIYCLEAYPYRGSLGVGGAFRRPRLISRGTFDVREGAPYLDAGIRGMELYTELVEKEGVTWTPVQYTKAAENLLPVSRLLRSYHDQHAVEENRERLAYLRSLVRKAVPFHFERIPSKNDQDFFHSMCTIYAPYWFDTGEETLAFYRQFLKLESPVGAWNFFRDPMPQGDQVFWAPYLVAWSREEEARFNVTWTSFLGELFSSTDPDLRALSLLLEFDTAPDEKSREAIKQRMRVFLSKLYQDFKAKPRELEDFRNKNRFFFYFDELLGGDSVAREFQKSIGGVGEPHPSLISAPLQISRLWTGEHFMGDNDISEFPVWHGEKIFFLNNKTKQVVCMNPMTFEQTVTPFPEFKFSVYFDFVAAADHFLVLKYMDQLFVQDRATQIWKILKITKLNYWEPFIDGDFLYTGFQPYNGPREAEQRNSGILRINLVTGEEEILASNQRKPAACFLDDTFHYEIKGIWKGAQKTILFNVVPVPVREENPSMLCSFDPESKKWSEVFNYRGDKSFGSEKGILFQGWNEFFSYSLDGKVVQLFQGGKKRTCSLSPSNSKPFWQRNWDNDPPLFTYDGLNFYILSIDFNKVSSREVGGIALSLEIFQPGHKDPVIIPLRFDSDDKNKSIKPPVPYEMEIKPIGGGLVLTTKIGMSGCWFIPMSDLDPYLGKKKVGTR